jgi:hypothetical protein
VRGLHVKRIRQNKQSTNSEHARKDKSFSSSKGAELSARTKRVCEAVPDLPAAAE